MIGSLHGTLREKHPPYLLLDVQGVGYELEAPMTTFYVLPEVGKELNLYTHMVVREDAQNLYGFAHENERNVFRLLLRVNGVGAKLALAILSGMDAGAFSRCVYAGDTASLVRLPGVGRKTAERLVMEMRDHLERLPHVPRRHGTPPVGEESRITDPADEAMDALVALGFKPMDARARIEAIDCQGLACEDIIRRALQGMVKPGT